MALLKEDMLIVERVNELALKYNHKMSKIALSWLFYKGVTSPIIEASKMSYLDDAVNELNIKLNDEDIKYLEELYVPHPINVTIVNN